MSILSQICERCKPFLRDDQCNKLIEILSTVWAEGNRHQLALAGAGSLLWQGCGVEETLYVISEVCDRCGDEEVDDRLQAVEDTYRVENPAGLSRLKELLMDEVIAELLAVFNAEHVYMDENGMPIYRILRYYTQKGKTFKAEHLVGTGWVNGQGSAPKRLYNAPDVKRAIGNNDPIWLPAGEKCADRLTDIFDGHFGAVTTNPFGEGKWLPQYTDQLQGAQVVYVLPDNDTIGQRHAAQVARALSAAGIPCKVVDLPDLPPKGDLVDWFACSGTVERLLKLADQAPFFSAPTLTMVETPERKPIVFPKETVTGVCAEIAEMFSSRLEAPFSYWANAALTCLGATISGSITLDTELSPQPRLYTAIIGPSAQPRKTTANDMTIHFFREALGEAMPHIENGLGSGEGLAHVLQEKRHCLLSIDELKLLVQKARIENSSLLPMLCSLYHKNDFSNQTRKSRLNVQGAHISMLSACTEETFDGMWSPEFLDIGFINRLWLVPGVTEKVIPFPEPIPQAEKERLSAGLREIVLELREKAASPVLRVGAGEVELPLLVPAKLVLEPDAVKLWETWYISRPRSIHANRLDVIGMRLMIILSVSQGNLETVDAATVANVIKLLDWQLLVRQAHDPIDSDNKAAHLEQLIKRALLRAGTLPEGRLRKAINQERYGEWLFAQAVRNLENSGRLVIVRKGGRSYFQLVDIFEEEVG